MFKKTSLLALAFLPFFSAPSQSFAHAGPSLTEADRAEEVRIAQWHLNSGELLRKGIVAYDKCKVASQPSNLGGVGIVFGFDPYGGKNEATLECTSNAMKTVSRIPLNVKRFELGVGVIAENRFFTYPEWTLSNLDGLKLNDLGTHRGGELAFCFGGGGSTGSVWNSGQAELSGVIDGGIGLGACVNYTSIGFTYEQTETYLNQNFNLKTDDFIFIQVPADAKVSIQDLEARYHELRSR